MQTEDIYEERYMISKLIIKPHKFAAKFLLPLRESALVLSVFPLDGMLEIMIF